VSQLACKRWTRPAFAELRPNYSKPVHCTIARVCVILHTTHTCKNKNINVYIYVYMQFWPAFCSREMYSKNISSQRAVIIVYHGVGIMACGCRRSSANGIYGCAVYFFYTTTECTITQSYAFASMLTTSIVFDLLSAIVVRYGVLRQVIESEFSRVRSIASSFNLKSPFVSVRSSSS
jgi:hypothetical protein